MRRPRFVIRRIPTGWYYVLNAANGETLVTSEVFETRQAAEKGVRSVMVSAPLARIDKD